MSTIIYGNIVSTRTQRVILLLEELGIEYDIHTLHFEKGDHQDPKYVKERHPFAKVPAFQDADVNLFESRAICRYLANKYQSELSPSIKDNKTLALFEQAASVEVSYFEPAIEKLGFELIFKKALGIGETDEEIVNQQKAQLSKVLDYYENSLSQQDYLAGETYSLVDLFHVPWIGFIQHRLQLSNEIESRKNLKAWWNRVSQRAATKAVLAKTTEH
ncbi:glutathione S-transferase [Dactylonectria estremocensis]|uniref:glutathione transferase n=1 Tax=Dactylonectria estremocensis TaxID=1079267 RepID=A0A9P9D5C9_9HYPO|nr:glutathione S-transferase [Dactylonectria estremocensis]